MKFALSGNVTPFSRHAGGVGTRVLDATTFLDALERAVEEHDTSTDRAPGQHFVRLGSEVFPAVSCGVGRKTDNPDDYIVRMYRGQPTMFLRREYAAPVEGLAAVVYTREAYLADPDVQADPARQNIGDATHVIVAVLAFAGPQAPLSPWRFVHNLAGGNREVDDWTMADVVAKATAIREYWSEWEVVSD